jgi:hypothetical protein
MSSHSWPYFFRKSKAKLKLRYDQWSVGLSVLVSSRHSGPKTSFLLMSDSYTFVEVGCPLWWEDGYVIYNCCWPSPAQLFLGPNPAGFMTMFYCLRFDTPPTWRARLPYLYPPGTGWSSYTPRHWVCFSSLPTTCRHAVEVFKLAFTYGNSSNSWMLWLCSLGPVLIENMCSNSSVFWGHMFIVVP